jgi:hypothetical protein
LFTRSRHALSLVGFPSDDAARRAPPQVPGCGGSLDTGRMYNIRYRLCQAHLRAESVQFQGRVQRFCQARAAGGRWLFAPPLVPCCRAAPHARVRADRAPRPRAPRAQRATWRRARRRMARARARGGPWRERRRPGGGKKAPGRCSCPRC